MADDATKESMSSSKVFNVKTRRILLRVRVNRSEHNKLTELASNAGLPVSTYVRLISLGEYDD